MRALTCTLLKEDFGLTIEIPLERLIPTVPLRLNYIHWVEDLIDGQKQPRRGIDIGTTTTTTTTSVILCPSFRCLKDVSFIIQMSSRCSFFSYLLISCSVPAAVIYSDLSKKKREVSQLWTGYSECKHLKCKFALYKSEFETCALVYSWCGCQQLRAAHK